jgi:hypothetical protein
LVSCSPVCQSFLLIAEPIEEKVATFYTKCNCDVMKLFHVALNPTFPVSP